VNGLEFSRHIHTTWPDLPIILSTGYSETVTRKKMDQAGIKGFIMKPLTRKALGE